MNLGEKQIARFWSKVEKASPDECWPWQGCTTSRGYGHVRLNRKDWRAHRIAWMLSTGKDIPAGLCVIHSCDHPACCNPAHLRLGTHRDNMRDKNEKGRQVRGEASGKARHSDIFICAVAAEHRASGRSIAATGRRYGIAYVTLYYWLKRERRASAFQTAERR